MSDVTYMRFAIVVMDRGEREGWRERFIEVLARGGVTLRNDKAHLNEIHLRGKWMGEGRIEPLEWADETLTRWIAVGTRPVVGAPAGLFVWSHFMSPSDAEDLVEVLAHAAWGAGYRNDTRQVREHVVRRRFQLTQLTSCYGFDEGSALLERKPGPYLDNVVAAVNQVLAANRIEIWVGYSQDADTPGNNPLRAWPPMSLAGEPVPVERVERVLSQLDVEIWAFHEKLGYPLDHFWTDADADGHA